MEDIRVTTESGFECVISGAAMDDMRTLDALVDAEVGNRTEKLIAIKKILDGLLGVDQKEALYQHVEERHGRPTVEAVKAELTDIFKKVGEAKKK